MVTLVTTNSFSTPQAAITVLPRIVGTQRAGVPLSIAAGSMTGLSSYQWRVNGANVSGAVGATFAAPMMPMGAQVSCLVTGVQGTAETPAVRIYHAHSDPSHNTMDDAVLALVPHTAATHIATRDGAWSSAATWDAGSVPGAGAVVLVPFGRTVTYDVASAPRLDRVRLDGVLTVSILQDTEMLVETVVVTQSGELRVGTPAGRLPDQFRHVLTFSDRHYPDSATAPSDISLTHDPMLLSRGLLWHGRVSVWAQNVTPWLRTAPASAPRAGDTSLTLAEAPTGWAVGDTIVIGGTFFRESNGIITGEENEERVITSINGATVGWAANAPLAHDHDHQNPAITGVADLQPAVLNKKRNVIWRSEAPNEDKPWRRGHSMAMHMTTRVDLWGVACLDMGRTDKSIYSGIIRGGRFASYPYDSDEEQYVGQSIDASLQATLEGQGYTVLREGGTVTAVERPATNPDGLPRISVNGAGAVQSVNQDVIRYSPLTAQSNLQSRYPLHVHFAGFGRGAQKPVIQDCYVENAPAWAYVHHGCEADFFDNVGYRFVGAGMVSETADELGAWVGNLMIGTRPGFAGNRVSAGNPKNDEGASARYGDFGFTGMGMFFRGRAMRVNNNMVMSVPSAYVFFHRANRADNPAYQLSKKLKVPRAHLDIGSLSYLDWQNGYLNAEDVPIRHFAGNECAGVQGYGFAVTKSGAKQDHALAINVKNNKFWAVGIGTHLEYVARYNFLDNRFYATGRTIGGKTKTGFRLAAIQISNVRNHVEGFDVAFDLWGVSNFAWTKDFNLPDDPLFAIIAPTLVNNTVDYEYTEAQAERDALTTVTAQDRTLFLPAVPAEVAPTLSGPFIAYDWTGGTQNVDVEKSYDYTNSVFTVTDSLGTAPIPVSYDTSGLWYGKSDHNIKTIEGVRTEVDEQDAKLTGKLLQEQIARVGYWTYQGDDIAVFPLYISDRVTGRPALYTVAVRCTGTVRPASTFGSANGAFTLSATGPARADITATTDRNTPVTLNVLAGASGEAGAPLSLFGDRIKPDYGELKDNGDGTVTYTPDRDYVSPAGIPDTMFVFVTDGRGRFETVKISITTS